MGRQSTAWAIVILAAAGSTARAAEPDQGIAPASEAGETSLAAGPAARLEEVVVTARRKEERQQDVPLAITTLSADFLRENAVVGLHDLNGQVPGLNIDNFNSPVYTNVGIRGQRSDNIAPGQDPAVGYYFSEVSFSYPIGINEQLYDLQSLEVVKGPQGTLFGRNTTGGAVVITPAAPTGSFGGSVTAGLTAFENGIGYYTTDVINLPVSEVLQLRAAVNVIDHDGYVKNLVTPAQVATFNLAPFYGSSNADPDDEHSYAGRIMARLHLSDALDSNFLLQGSDYRDHGEAYSLTALAPAGYANFALSLLGVNGQQVFQSRQSQQAGNFWTTQSGLNARNHSDNISASNTTTWTVAANLTLKNIVGYRHFDEHQTIPLDGVPYQILDTYIGDTGHELSEELQLQGKAADDSFDWVAGYYYSTQNIDHPRATLALPEFGAPPSHAEEQSDNASMAEYAQGTVKVPTVAGLSFTAGIRNTRDTRKMTSTSWNDPAQTSCAIAGVVNCELAGDVAYSVVTYNLGLEYKLDPNTLVYVTRRKGYRAGGWNYVGSDPASFGPFRPEYVNDWELGVKRDWHFGDALLRTNLAAYRSRLSDAQKFLSPVSNPNDFEVINAADATIDGGELEITFIPIRSLELGASLSIIDAAFNRFASGGNDFTGNAFAQTPRNQYSMRGRYSLPLTPALGTVALEVDYAYQSRIFYTDTSQGPTQGPPGSQGQGAYGLLNARIDWKSLMRSKLDAALYVRNATARQFNTFGVLLYPSLGYNVATIGQPRIFGLEASYHF